MTWCVLWSLLKSEIFGWFSYFLSICSDKFLFFFFTCNETRFILHNFDGFFKKFWLNIFCAVSLLLFVLETALYLDSLRWRILWSKPCASAFHIESQDQNVKDRFIFLNRLRYLALLWVYLKNLYLCTLKFNYQMGQRRRGGEKKGFFNI